MRENEINMRRGTAAQWRGVNPILAAGEPGFESDTKKFKLGDGTTAWNSLPYFRVDGGNLDGAAPPIAMMRLAAMNIGAWGDPHFYIRKPQTLNPSNYRRGVFLAKWDDNKAGATGLNEIRFIDLQTATGTVKIFYTNKQWNNGAKVISNIRVELNGNSTTYTNNADVTAGPITMNIMKFGSGSNAYLWFEMKWGAINNVVKFKGAFCMILKRMSATKGVFNGGSGLLWDGFGRAAQPYGLSRASFETNNVGMLTDDSAEVFSGLENQDFEDVSTATTAETNFDEGLNNNGDGEGNPGDNQPVSQWDDLHEETNAAMATGVHIPGGPQSETSPYPQLMNKIDQISW
jgi:hypothetical protein